MLYYVLQCFFVLFLIAYWKGGNNCFKILSLLQMASFVMGPIVANYVIFDTIRTVLNTIFCLLNLWLITASWRRTEIEKIEIEDVGLFAFYKKVLYIVLSFTIINNIIVAVIIYTKIPDIATFKALKGYRTLYDSIPFFGIMFRYTAISRYIGLLALPICAYYLEENMYRKALKAFLMSTSTLTAALASYSRADFLSYGLLCVCLFYYVNRSFDKRINNIARKIIMGGGLLAVAVLASITVIRFTSSTMWYYSDRIPESSVVKSPALYSIFDYASMGFPDGINQLEVHEIDDVMMFEPIIYDLNLMLSYFHLTSWNSGDYAQRLAKVYNKPGLNPLNDAGTFHGYACSTIKMFGYTGTLLFSILYYRYVRRKSCNRIISIGSLSVILFLLNISINSMFYSSIAPAVYPVLFYCVISLLYKLKRPRLVIKTKWVL